MNIEFIFFIPFIVGIVWIIKEAIMYNRVMKNMIRKCEFTLVEKDGLLYITPILKNEKEIGSDRLFTRY